MVETTIVEDNSAIYGHSDLMTPYIKDGIQSNAAGTVTDPTFYLADTEAFLDPCCMIHDIGGPVNCYFLVKPRNEWAKEFIRWVEAKHSYDVMENPNPVDSEDKEMADEEEDGAL